MGKTILNKTGQDIEQLCEKKLASINANPIIEKTSIEDGIVRENTIYRLGTVTSAPVITAVENSYNESIIVFKTGPNVTYLNENNYSVNGLTVPQFIPTGYSLVGVPVKILEQDSSYVICYWNHLVIIKKLHDCSGAYDYSDCAYGADAERSYVVYSGEDRDKKIKSGLGCVVDTNNKIDIISDGGIVVKIGYYSTETTIIPGSTFFGSYFANGFHDLRDCTITGLRIGSELDDFVPSREFHDIPIEVDYGNQKLKINNDGFLIRTEGTTKKLCFVTTDSSLVNANKIDLTNSGITSLDQYPFINCSLSELILPATIDHINEYTFIKRDDGGDDLSEDIIESVTFKGTIAQWESVTTGFSGDYYVYWPLVVHCSDGDWTNTDRLESENNNEG